MKAFSSLFFFNTARIWKGEKEEMVQRAINPAQNAMNPVSGSSPANCRPAFLLDVTKSIITSLTPWHVQRFQQICALPINARENTYLASHALDFRNNQPKKKLGQILSPWRAKHDTSRRIRAIFNFSFIVESVTESHSHKYHMEGSGPAAEKGRGPEGNLKLKYKIY